jgi:shikimate dehydrogenase
MLLPRKPAWTERRFTCRIDEDQAVKLVGLIGHPLAHSVSPAFQQAAFDDLGLDVRYEAWDTLPEGLPQRVQAVRGVAVLGANITVPHKEAVIALLDDLDTDARAIGAVNTVVNRSGDLVGYNTDVTGFERACEEAGIDLALRPALVVGAGGAARAVVYALTRADVRSITVINRRIDRARHLAIDLGVGCDSLAEVAPSLLRSAQLVVNATPLGMLHGSQDLPLEPRRLSPGCYVVDLVANPLETAFLRAAREAGCQALGGLSMLVHQGAQSFRLWTGHLPSIERMTEVARRATERSIEAAT